MRNSCVDVNKSYEGESYKGVSNAYVNKSFLEDT